MVSDPKLNRVLLVEESTGAWTWDGSNWTQVSAPPAGSWVSAIAFDGIRVVALGGLGTGTSKTLTWAGSEWSDLTPSPAPPAGMYVLGTAPGGNGVVAFGGGELPLPVNDTWGWDSLTTSWRLVPTQHSPGPAAGGGLANDGRQLLLFGGYQANDLWAWSGGDWTMLNAGSGTPAASLGNRMPADRVAAAERAYAGGTSPLLTPGWMPAGMTQGWVESDSVKGGGAPIDFGFYDEAHQRSIRISVVVPGNSNLAAANRRLSFRGAEAYYQYFTGAAPLPLSLAWTEPGHWSGGSEQLKIPGVPYVLAAYGLSEADFWRVANSLQAS